MRAHLVHVVIESTTSKQILGTFVASYDTVVYLNIFCI